MNQSTGDQCPVPHESGSESSASLETAHQYRRASDHTPSHLMSEDGTPRRRWNDHLGDLPERMFSNFLMGRPSRDDIVRYLSALLTWPIGARGALIVEGDGTSARITASFIDGDPAGGTQWTVGTMPALLAEALEHPSERHEVELEAQSTEPVHSMLVMPLGNSQANRGALVVILTSPAARQMMTEKLARLPQMIGLYLAGLGSGDATHNHANGVAVDQPRRLSERQLRILGLLSEGLTMRQIANRIGYSESTVRMESLAIYRSLDVHDRENAVHAGCALGLL